MSNVLPRGESYFICGHGEPVELNRCSGDVLFPRSWSIEQAARWRQRHIVPGPEWPTAQPTPAVME